jgi:hypothetical protein
MMHLPDETVRQESRERPDEFFGHHLLKREWNLEDEFGLSVS